MNNMLRRQAYFAVISFIVLCVGLSIAQFVFGFSFSPAHLQPPVVQSSVTLPSNSKPPFWFSIFLLIISLVILIGGACLSYFSWFKRDKLRANLERTRELARQGQSLSLRHDYSQINITASIWSVRFFSPIMVILGFILFLAAVSSF